MGHVSFNRIFAGYGTACSNKKEIDRNALQSSQADKPQPVKLKILTPGIWGDLWSGTAIRFRRSFHRKNEKNSNIEVYTACYIR
jgi:hypothetical protein